MPRSRPTGRRLMVATAEHGSGLILAQIEVGTKSNEILAVRELSSSLDLTGRIVTVDAMHAQHETACRLIKRRAVKDNQKTIFR